VRVRKARFEERLLEEHVCRLLSLRRRQAQCETNPFLNDDGLPMTMFWPHDEFSCRYCSLRMPAGTFSRSGKSMMHLFGLQTCRLMPISDETCWIFAKSIVQLNLMSSSHEVALAEVAMNRWKLNRANGGLNEDTESMTDAKFNVETALDA